MLVISLVPIKSKYNVVCPIYQRFTGLSQLLGPSCPVEIVSILHTLHPISQTSSLFDSEKFLGWCLAFREIGCNVAIVHVWLWQAARKINSAQRATRSTSD